jgi:hypothetical protein
MRKDSDAPALRWASEFSQRENCHQSIAANVFCKAYSLEVAVPWKFDFER